MHFRAFKQFLVFKKEAINKYCKMRVKEELHPIYITKYFIKTYIFIASLTKYGFHKNLKEK